MGQKLAKKGRDNTDPVLSLYTPLTTESEYETRHSVEMKDQWCTRDSNTLGTFTAPSAAAAAGTDGMQNSSVRLCTQDINTPRTSAAPSAADVDGNDRIQNNSVVKDFNSSAQADSASGTVDPSVYDSAQIDLKSLLMGNAPALAQTALPQRQLRPSEWVEIRLFISSTFIDTHSERDVLVKKIIPELNQKLKHQFIRIVPVDLRWGVLKEESKDCYAIQATCLNEIDRCRQDKNTHPYFIGIRTQRYGWVQNNLLSSNKFENPELYGWMRAIEEYGKELSITSLEVIHAVWLMEHIPPAPTVLFYKREIENPENIEENMKWVFNFEYISEAVQLHPDVANQFTKTTKAHIFQDDKEKLEQYLQTLDYVKYSNYVCSYEKGGARVTGQNHDKKFGIGNVEGLVNFEQMVKEDLLNAIQKNFEPADLSKIHPNDLINMPFEDGIKEKASTFVERPGLVKQILMHCTTDVVSNSVMIVSGEPGQGKSALIAYAANKCMNELRSNNFVFAHGVDMCPQSNDLELMLFRLHENICIHTGTENTLESSEDLRSQHVLQLEEIARNHPEQLFVIFVDAVNQFHERMQSWRMWWLPSEDAPINLRFIISTLVKENKTYENALKVCPDAVVVPVEDMSESECKEMVTALLARFNKKLTTHTDKFLKNQMQLLVDKNRTPLFLSAACEALRTQGVYEEMTVYIETLPKIVSDLFQSLLDKWSVDYGEEFIRYLAGILTLSRNGLLQNMVSDILDYIEKRKQLEFHCSFSMVYASIQGFLSSGGGGNIRFFHDQINQVVRQKYLTSVFEAEVHHLLAGYYLDQIHSQLCEKPTSPPGWYFEDSIRHVVTHQIAARTNEKVTVDFSQTLRNVFFIREKVKLDQVAALKKDYLTALKYEVDEGNKIALRQWQRFTNFYTPFIKQLPQWVYNMAANQIQSTHVYMDTMNLNINVAHCENHPTYWMNKPPTETDTLLLKYMSGPCWSCAATNVKGNMVAVSSAGMDDGMGVFVYDMNTAELLQQVEDKFDHTITSLTFTNDYTLLWLGDIEGSVHVCDLTTGKVVWRCEERIGGGWIKWLQHIDDYIVCGTEGNYECDATVAFIVISSKLVQTTWRLGEWCNVYHYHDAKQLILSGHKNTVKCWSLGGELVRNVGVGGWIFGLDVHPANQNLVVCAMSGRVVQLNMMSGEVMWTVKGMSHKCQDVSYTHGGERIVCVSADAKTLFLLDGEGNNTNCVKGHFLKIRNIRMILGTNHLVTAGGDGSYLFNLPTTPDQHVDEHVDEDTVVLNVCTALNNTEHFLIRSKGDEYKIERCSSETCEVIASVDVGGWGKRIVAHPLNSSIVVASVERDLLFLNTTDLRMVAKHNVCSYVGDLVIGRDGNKCLVATSRHSLLYDIGDLNNITTLATFEMKHGISSDIHNDGMKVVCGGKDGLVLYDVTTSKPIKTLTKEVIRFARFRYQPESVLYSDGSYFSMMTLDGVLLHKFAGEHVYISLTLINDSLLLSGNEDKSIHMHDTTTGQTVSMFYHPSTDRFTCFAYQPEHNRLIAGNKNGKVYVIGPSPI